MTLALSIWNDRIAPVFDWSRELVLVSDSTSDQPERTVVEIADVIPVMRTAKLSELGVDTLICGAISNFIADMIEGAGIRLIPFVDGDLDQVLAAYLSGSLPANGFYLPGCRGRRRGRGPGGNRQGPGRRQARRRGGAGHGRPGSGRRGRGR